MQNSFIVKQNRGQDSLVTVTEDVITGYPDDEKVLIFETDQSLHSSSDRAWLVESAIKTYADERGYRIDDVQKYKVVAVYDKVHHSRVLEYELRKQVNNHPDFEIAAREATNQAETVNQAYGQSINELKHLVFLLEESLRDKLKAIAADLVEKQRAIIQEIGQDERIQDYQMFANRHPLVKIEPSHHYKCTDQLPSDLNKILDLLK